MVQHAKAAAVPALYFTNLISARPLMGVAGAGSLAQVVNAALGNRARFDQMREFFGDVGTGDRAGVWREVPGNASEAWREQQRKRRTRRPRHEVEGVA